MINLALASLFFVIGVGVIGGALFGKLQSRRLFLLVIGIALWSLAAYLFIKRDANDTKSPTAVSTVLVAESTTPTTAPTATPVPTATSTPTPTPPSKWGALVFPSARSGNLDIWSVDLTDLSSFTQLTTDPQSDVEPRWSPDGSQILFASGRDANGVHELYLMDADGGNQHRILEWPDSYEWGGTWSPDGKYIAFTSTHNFNYEIFVMNADGSGEPINLTQNPALDSYPDWSPDGRWLVFVSDRGGNWDVWKMDVESCLAARQAQLEDGACDSIPLTADNPDDDFYPRWSPDSRRIAFESRRHANRDIYLMDADGGNLTRLTRDIAHDSNPIWAMDGQVIIFSSERNFDWNLYMINLESGEEKQITHAAGEDRFGDWKP